MQKYPPWAWLEKVLKFTPLKGSALLSLEQHSEIPILKIFVNWGKLEAESKTDIQKSLFWIDGWIVKSFVLKVTFHCWKKDM